MSQMNLEAVADGQLQESTLIYGGTPAASAAEFRGDAIAFAAKRAFDVCVSSLLLLMVSLPMLLIAAAIKIDSRGPVFFCQKRRGRDLQPFTIFKFRTMRVNEPDPHERYETVKQDARITRIGQLLRMSSLDELPQLINVLLGTMSLVGPRPLVEWESLEAAESHCERFLMSPGITGLTQVSGRNSLSSVHRLDKDVEYVRDWSLWLDLKIFLLTPLSLLRTNTIYPES